jgi:hypothetical protein
MDKIIYCEQNKTEWSMKIPRSQFETVSSNQRERAGGGERERRGGGRAERGREGETHSRGTQTPVPRGNFSFISFRRETKHLL